MRFIPPKEIIGHPECPIFYRYMIRPWGAQGHSDANWKLMVHRFLPNADERDVHDHPRDFWTLVLWGYYDDIAEDLDGVQHVRERMCPGSFRHRPAEFTHRTRVGPKGCWTIVVMGKMTRSWGFWREGRWWPHKKYEEQFGYGMQCD